MIRFLAFLICISLTGNFLVASAQDKKSNKKAVTKKADKKKPAAKKQAAPTSQEWGRFSSGGKKDLDAQEKAKKEAAKKKQP
jgi:hypothetical protein